MTTPLISVIVPVYNVEPHLRKCLDSVTQQTYENIEIICVDDGSTDNSPAILAEYAARDSRIIIHTQPNAGLSAARNAGLRIARGEWITGLDSDDWLEKDAYEYFYTNRPQDETKLAVVGIDCVEHESGKVLWKARMPMKGLVKATPATVQIDAWFWNKFWHRSLVCDGDVTFPEGAWYEDAPFWHMIAPYQKQILFLPDIKYHYMKYRGGNSISDQAKQRHEKGASLVLNTEIVLQYRRKHPLPDDMVITDLWMVEYYYRMYLQRYNAEHQDEVWQHFRHIVDSYGMLENIYSSPKLALYYSLPPCAVDALSKLYVAKNEYKRDQQATRIGTNNRQNNALLFILNGRKLMYLYRKTQLSYFCSWGKRRKKYKQRVQRLRQYIRDYRNMKKNTWESFVRQVKADSPPSQVLL